MNRMFLSFGIVFLSLPFLSAQSSFDEDLRFVAYLIENRLYKDALVVLDQRAASPYLASGQKDSLLYYLGNVHLATENWWAAGQYYSKVSEKAPFFLPAYFIGGWSFMQARKYPEAAGLLGQTVALPSKRMKALHLLQQQGLSLLQRDFAQYEAFQATYESSFSAYGGLQDQLQDHFEAMRQINSRSPALAGILSALVPGAGKWYAGKPGEALSTFVPVVVFGLQAYEGYRKDGLKSARLYVFGGLFTLFYIGNIWGSVLSVKIKQGDAYAQLDRQILFDLRVPLRKLSK